MQMNKEDTTEEVSKLITELDEVDGRLGIWAGNKLLNEGYTVETLKAELRRLIEIAGR